MYQQYYADQSGSGIPVFVGQRHQRGHGLGQTIGGLFQRFVIPFVAPRAKEVGKKILGNVVKTGMEVAGDVFSGKSAKEALKERGLAGIKRTISDIVRQSPTVGDRVNIATAPRRVSQSAEKEEKESRKTEKKRHIRMMAFVSDFPCECVKTELSHRRRRAFNKRNGSNISH